MLLRTGIWIECQVANWPLSLKLIALQVDRRGIGPMSYMGK